MANDNNNINELVSEDDDPTAELEVPEFAAALESESDAKTYDVDERIDASGVSVSELESDLRSRQETISRLQYDIEQLHSKWVGLEAEISARESQTETLNAEVADLGEALERKDKLIRKRDKQIRALKKEIRQRDEQHRSLIDDFQAVQESLQQDENGQKADLQRDPSIEDLGKDELIARLNRSDDYADSIRRQLQDLIESTSDVEKERDQLRMLLAGATNDNEDLTNELNDRNAERNALRAELDAIEENHAEEIRIVRFELGQAQNTIVETEQVNNQLASDLVDTRNFNDELERMLSSTEEESRHQIDDLRKEVARLTRDAEAYEQKLNTKSEAITVLLAELAKKSEQLESIGEIEDVIHDIDDRITERIDPPAAPPPERTTRLLVGTVDGQVLRFPLFKDRLSIGRTEDNDIQLKAAYISRRHAVVQTDREITRIIDWGSKNGVYANGERVKEHFLEHGDIVTIGHARFRYEERPKRDS